MDFIAGPSRELAFVCAAYALGCFSSGYYLVRLCSGKDIRTISSRSTGSTNVGRVLGRSGYIVTLFADCTKGAIALWAALHFGLSPWGAIGVMISVVTGHIWPIQLRFHGGKGLATAFGALIVLDYRLALVIGSIAMLGPLLRQGTASFLAAAFISPGLAAVLGRPEVEVAGLGILVLLLLIAHRENIRAFLVERRARKGLQA